MKRLLLLGLAFASACSVAGETVEYSADAYAVCSACHLAGGEGIPGAFPPLKNRAAKMASLDGGREYLISVVSSGLMGMLDAEGATYMGVMPGHQGSMSQEQIADALNYVVFSLADDASAESEVFTADEVAAQQAAVESPSPAVAAEMRTGLVDKHGDAWPQ